MSDVLSQTHPKRLEVRQIGHRTDTCQTCQEEDCPIKKGLMAALTQVGILRDSIDDRFSEFHLKAKNPLQVSHFDGDERFIDVTTAPQTDKMAVTTALCWENTNGGATLVGVGKWEVPLKAVEA